MRMTLFCGTINGYVLHVVYVAKYLSVTNHAYCSVSRNNRFNNSLEIMPSEEFGTCPRNSLVLNYKACTCSYLIDLESLTLMSSVKPSWTARTSWSFLCLTIAY